LKLSIAAAIEKLNPGNIRCIRNKLLRLNIVRGKGLFCRFILNAQLESPESTNMYATLVSYINLQVDKYYFFIKTILLININELIHLVSKRGRTAVDEIH